MLSIKKDTILKLLDIPDVWDSLVINKRKPETCRVFTFVGENRVCLHRFQIADSSEAFWHPHPWPARFYILSGAYKLFLSTSKDRDTGYDPAYSIVTMRPRSYYEMSSPLAWHKIVPITTTYTLMINGPEWPDSEQHKAVRRTKGKDLEKMPRGEVIAYLAKFKTMIHSYMDEIL